MRTPSLILETEKWKAECCVTARNHHHASTLAHKRGNLICGGRNKGWKWLRELLGDKKKAIWLCLCHCDAVPATASAPCCDLSGSDASGCPAQCWQATTYLSCSPALSCEALSSVPLALGSCSLAHPSWCFASRVAVMAKIWLPQGTQPRRGIASLPSFFYSVGTMFQF